MIPLDLLPTSPSIKILTATMRTLRAFDWAAYGLENIRFRYRRNRNPTPTEFPCVTLQYIHDEPRQADQDGSYYTAGETCVEMMLVLQIEDELEPEYDDNLNVDALDPTGLLGLTGVAVLCLTALKDPEGELRQQWADDVADRGRSESPEGQNAESRFDQTAIVLYRVMTDDPSTLLAQGENA